MFVYLGLCLSFFRLSGSLSDCLFVYLGICLSACLDVWSYLWNLIRFASDFIKKHVRSTEMFWAQFNFLNWVILTFIGKTTGKNGFPSQYVYKVVISGWFLAWFKIKNLKLSRLAFISYFNEIFNICEKCKNGRPHFVNDWTWVIMQFRLRNYASLI